MPKVLNTVRKRLDSGSRVFLLGGNIDRKCPTHIKKHMDEYFVFCKAHGVFVTLPHSWEKLEKYLKKHQQKGGKFNYEKKFADRHGDRASNDKV